MLAISKHTGVVPGRGGLGEYLRDQRRAAELTLRQLAEQAGVSNPYLSQIENGLRRPSAEVLQRLAAALRVSAEALYVRAGLIEQPGENRSVEIAIASDLAISERQKRVLLDIYAAFRREHADTLAAAAPAGPAAEEPTRPATGDQPGGSEPVTGASDPQPAARNPQDADEPPPAAPGR
jgi:transcriptional regulator with XRE-family HTH domain